MIKVNASYTKEKYCLTTDHAELLIGNQDGEVQPYELLFGALSSCFYYTLKGILDKRRIEVEEVRVRVEGVKRTTIPTTLKEAKLYVTFIGDVDEKTAHRAAQLAGEYCSIHRTLALVADISHEVKVIRKL